jgi:hypothetical protein
MKLCNCGVFGTEMGVDAGPSVYLFISTIVNKGAKKISNVFVTHIVYADKS